MEALDVVAAGFIVCLAGIAQSAIGFGYALFATSLLLWNAVIGIAFLPLVYLATAIGLPIGNRMAKNKLTYIAYVILLVVGISAIVPAIPTRLK